MTNAFTIVFTSLSTFIISCNTSSTNFDNKKIPLISKDTTNEIEKNNGLFVFVGEKIDAKPIPYTPGNRDNGIKAKYKILQVVYGDYYKDEIEFEAYDHYTTPEFITYKTVLLFISEFEGKYYQQKYMFDPLAKTKDGRWAGPYSSDYEHPYNKHTKIKPEKIDFIEDISFPTKFKNDDGNEFTLSYPEPYFKTVGDKAIAVYGNYIPELFKLKKEGVLTARGLFSGKTKKELELSKDTISEKW